MTRRTQSIEPGWFEQLYATDPDPWRFATSEYEAQKYAATLDALPPGRFASALEVGCSIGVLTRQLALRCDTLLSIDVSETALAQARIGNPGVNFSCRAVPAEWPPGRFDLILFSEVLYYLDEADIRATARAARESLSPGGTILMVHYLGETDYPTTGDAAPGIFTEASGLTPSLRLPRNGYRIDRLTAPAATSPG